MIQGSGIWGKANMAISEAVVTTVHSFPYHLALNAWPVIRTERAPIYAWVSSLTAMNPNRRNTWG